MLVQLLVSNWSKITQAVCKFKKNIHFTKKYTLCVNRFHQTHSRQGSSSDYSSFWFSFLHSATTISCTLPLGIRVMSDKQSDKKRKVCDCHLCFIVYLTNPRLNLKKMVSRNTKLVWTTHITYNILNKLPAAFNQHTKRTTLHHTQHTHTTSTNTSTHKHATDHTQHTYTHTQKSHAAHITVPHARTNPHNTDNTDTTQTHHNAA